MSVGDIGRNEEKIPGLTKIMRTCNLENIRYVCACKHAWERSLQWAKKHVVLSGCTDPTLPHVYSHPGMNYPGYALLPLQTSVHVQFELCMGTHSGTWTPEWYFLWSIANWSWCFLNSKKERAELVGAHFKRWVTLKTSVCHGMVQSTKGFTWGVGPHPPPPTTHSPEVRVELGMLRSQNQVKLWFSHR